MGIGRHARRNSRHRGDKLMGATHGRRASLKVVNARGKRHERMMIRMGVCFGLAEIRYEVLPHGENYVMVSPEGTQLTLEIRARKDGQPRLQRCV